MKGKLFLLGALLLLAYPNLAQAAAGLKITQCEAVSAFGEPPYLLLNIEYPQDIKKSGEEILVNGSKTAYFPAGGGFGGGLTQESYWLYVGGPGQKEIKVVIKSADKSLEASQTVDFRSQGEVLWLDHVDGEAIFARGEFRFFAYFFQDLKISVNGREMKYHSEPSRVSADHYLIRCTPELSPGNNTMLVSWKSLAGQPCSRKYHVYLVKADKVKQGDTLKLVLGESGSKSGPFYRAKVEGNSLEVTGKGLENQITLLDGVRLALTQQYVATLKVKEPGTGLIKVYVKKIFWQPEELDRQLKLVVVK